MPDKSDLFVILFNDKLPSYIVLFYELLHTFGFYCWCKTFYNPPQGALCLKQQVSRFAFVECIVLFQLVLILATRRRQNVGVLHFFSHTNFCGKIFKLKVRRASFTATKFCQSFKGAVSSCSRARQFFFQTSKKSKLSINTANNWILIWTTPICKKLHKFMTMKTSYSLPALVAQKKKDLFVISEGGLGWFLKYNKRINWKGIDVIFNYPATVICDYWRTIYTTENFWLGADKNGTHTKKQMVQHG